MVQYRQIISYSTVLYLHIIYNLTLRYRKTTSTLIIYLISEEQYIYSLKCVMDSNIIHEEKQIVIEIPMASWGSTGQHKSRQKYLFWYTFNMQYNIF